MIWIYFFSLFFLAEPNYYIVVNVQGKAYAQRSGSKVIMAIVPGLKISSEDRIRFVNNTGVIRLAGRGGTFLLRPNADPRKETGKANELGLLLKDALSPTITVGMMRSRGGVISNEMEAELFFSSFNNNTLPMLILDTTLIEVNKTYFSDTAHHFFYLSYIKNKEQINKKIPWKHSSSSLFLSFDRRLFLIDGKDIGIDSLEHTKIYFYDVKNKRSVLLSDFNLRFINSRVLQSELCYVAEGLDMDNGAPLKDADKRLHLVNYVSTYYGRIDAEVFDSRLLPLLSLCKK